MPNINENCSNHRQFLPTEDAELKEIYARSADVSERHVGDELHLVSRQNKQTFCPNLTGAAIWRFLAEPHSLQSIIKVFQDAFPDQDEAKIESDVRAQLKTLSQLGVVEKVNATESRPKTTRNQEMGKKSSISTSKEIGMFDKYWHYQEATQSSDLDVLFFLDVYKELRKNKSPTSLREDFCGTFSSSCEWVKLGNDHTAAAVDISLEPINYGKKYNLNKLTTRQKNNIRIWNKNVLEKDLPNADIIAACNFSYFIFKDRATLKLYFENVLKGLNDGGLFILDIFGGSECHQASIEEIEYDNFSYFWDQDTFDPITNESMFYIHFKPKNGRRVNKAFVYDWRLWSIPEIRDVLKDAGFDKTHVYWEGTTEDGEGDDKFSRTDKGEYCESWIAYIVSEKP